MILILSKDYRSLYGRYAAVGELNTQGEHLIYAVVFFGLQALQLLGDGGGVGLDKALDVAFGGLVQLPAGYIVGRKAPFSENSCFISFGECPRGKVTARKKRRAPEGARLDN
jgi:hypothetical protein